MGEAHAALATVKYFYDWDWPAAEIESRRAIELSPNYPPAHQAYAGYLLVRGRNQEAISEIKQALELDPLSMNINVFLARVFFFSHEYDQTIEQCRRILEMDENFGPAHLFMGRAYKEKRMYQEALAELQKARTLLGDPAEIVAMIGYTNAVSGHRQEAEKIARDLQGLSKQRYVSPYHSAMLYAGLGERDEAFRLLEKAYEDREGRMSIIKLAPEFDGLRSDPRFADLIRRVGLSP
jgi:tetratricopeptide (TPR) repeat protein